MNPATLSGGLRSCLWAGDRAQDRAPRLPRRPEMFPKHRQPLWLSSLLQNQDPTCCPKEGVGPLRHTDFCHALAMQSLQGSSGILCCRVSVISHAGAPWTLQSPILHKSAGIVRGVAGRCHENLRASCPDPPALPVHPFHRAGAGTPQSAVDRSEGRQQEEGTGTPL